MTIGSGIHTFFPIYSANPVTGVQGPDAVRRGSEGTAVQEVGKTECQTCKERKYIDGSNDNSVSFQTPTHIDPSSSAAAVMGHEQEHVSNAVNEGNEDGKQLVSVSVSLQTSICPECGRIYVSGGTTKSTIATNYNESNPYDRMRKSLEGFSLAGSYVDTVA